MRRTVTLMAASVVLSGAAAADERSVSRTESTSVDIFNDNGCVTSSINVSRGTDVTGKSTKATLDYTILNYCKQVYIGDGHTDIPASAFVGDPRRGDTVSLRVDLRAMAASLQGTPLVADLVWRKTRDRVTTQDSRTVTTSRSKEQRSVTTGDFFGRSAVVTGSANLIAAGDLAAGSASISWQSSTTRTVSKGAN